MTRGRGEGSIRKRQDGRWEAVVQMGYFEGKRQRKSVYGRTRAEVNRKLLEVQALIATGVAPPPERLTVGRHLTDWLAHKRPSLRAKTYACYESSVRVHLVPALGNFRLARLTPQQVQSFLAAKATAGLSPRTVQMQRAVLRTALNHALRWSLVTRNVAQLTDSPRTTPRVVTPLTREEAEVLLRHVVGSRQEALYTVGLALGLRQAELLGLRWEDVDFEGRTLTVSQQLQRITGAVEFVEPKSATGRRVVPLDDVVVRSLRAHRLRQLEQRMVVGSRWTDSGLVFTTSIGTAMDSRAVLRTFHNDLAGAGLPRRRFHDLRHSCATFMALTGVSPRVAADILGHSDIRLTLQVYTHASVAEHREAIRRTGALLAAAADGHS